MYNIVMSVRFEDAKKYPYLELVAEWAMRTNNNIIQNMGKSVLLYPIFPEGYNQLDQQQLSLGNLVVMNNSGNKEDNYEYNPKRKTWSNLRYNRQSRFYNFNIEYDPFSHPDVQGFIYKITDNSVTPRTLGFFSVPYQPATPSIRAQAAGTLDPEPEPDLELDEANKFHRKIMDIDNTKARSGSPSPEMSGVGEECQGPSCAVMGGKKKTRRHKSRKQKKSKSKSKRHKKSKKHKKSKRHTRGRK